MSEQEIKLLELLLDKLQGHLHHRFAICSGIQDSWNIAAYSHDGELKQQTESYTLAEGVRLLQEKLKP